MKSAVGLVLAFGVGFSCRAFGIPSPSPTLVIGALLAITMTTGFRVADRWLARRSAP